MLLIFAFAGFSIIVLISFVLTCLPVQLSTEGGRADERAVHLEPYAFCIDDTALQQQTLQEQEEDTGAAIDEPLLVIPTQSSEQLKEAA